ncbi:MAG: hypothetical protein KGL39_38145 [Patescibacteria group bacterium]|nr:hypothetical protein [Patescibacteria group bacterium]
MIGLVGFAGRKRAGKDTAGAALVARGYKRLSFAGPLKAMLRALLMEQGVLPSVIEAMIEGDLREVPSDHLGGCTPRHAMQTLGTQWGRELIQRDLWVNAAITSARHSGSPVVFTDVRFQNEVDAIRQAGGIVIRIYRPTLFRADEHESEAGVDSLFVDRELVNNCADAHTLALKAVCRLCEWGVL